MNVVISIARSLLLVIEFQLKSAKGAPFSYTAIFNHMNVLEFHISPPPPPISVISILWASEEGSQGICNPG
jgi:hypothetical protein